MEFALGISVLLVCVCSGAEAQSTYDNQHYIPQQIRYDDDAAPTHYREPSSNAHEPIVSHQYPKIEGSPYPQQPDQPFLPTGSNPDVSGKLHYWVKNPMRGNPHAVHYRQPESVNSYHSQHDELQLSQPQRPSHASVIPPYAAGQEQLGYKSQPQRLSHMSVIYPKAAAQEQPEYQAGPEQLEHQPQPHRPSHTSIIPPPTSADEPHKPAAPEQPKLPDHHPTHPDHSRVVQSPRLPDHHPTKPEHSRVVRDPRLPLYFTMYEKRILQDPMDKYGKGPWRYLTYGHGITYGSKEPGKVFERGYGYIRALGRDHCKLPENRCPRRDDGKPFRYEGRKEPYFGYRPH